MDVMNRSNNQSSLWQPVQSFVNWSAPMYIRQALQFLWSFTEGTDTQVLDNRGGAQMQETSQVRTLHLLHLRVYLRADVLTASVPVSTSARWSSGRSTRCPA